MVAGKDIGNCCLFLPLKFGVGLISMLVFAQSVVSIVALFTGDIRFQANGYNVHTFHLPSVVGAGGLLFGFVGLLGVYDENYSWVRAFNRFLVAKLVVMAVATAADMWTLGKCDSWLTSQERVEAESYAQRLGHTNYVDSNTALDSLAELHVCPWARWAYLIGFSVDFALWTYCACKSFLFEWALLDNFGFPIDFGDPRYTAEHRWDFYHVKDPRMDALRPMRPSTKTAEEQDFAAAKYGTLGSPMESPVESSPTYKGRRPHREAPGYGPDGMLPTDRGQSASGNGFGSLVGPPVVPMMPSR